METDQITTDQNKRINWLLAGGLLIVIIYQGFTLGSVPAFPTDDDGAYAAAGYQFWQTGKPGVPGYKDVAGMARDIYVLGHIGAAAQGVFMYFFGVSVVTALLPSFFVGLGVLGMVFLLARELWDTRTGLLAALLLALSGVFFSATRSARPDLLVTFFFLVALWLAASAPAERPYWRLLLAGLTMGLAGDVHPNGFLIAPLPLAFWVLLRRPKWSLLWRVVLAYAIGGAAGILYWLARHYLPQPEDFRRQTALHGLATHGVKILEHGVFGAMGVELQRYLSWFWNARGHRHLFEGLAVLVSGAFLIWRGGRTGRAMVMVWLALFLTAAALMSNSFGYYLIFAWPLFALWLARAFQLSVDRVATASRTVPWRWLARGAVVLLIVAYLGNLGLWHWKARQVVPLQARLNELRALTPPDAPVFASAGLWFAFWDRDFTHEPYLPFRALEARLHPETGATGWEIEQRKFGWRYIVAYGNLRRAMDPEFPLEQMLAVEPWRTRPEEVRQARAFSLKRCEVISRLDGQDDTIVLLRVNEPLPTVAGNQP